MAKRGNVNNNIDREKEIQIIEISRMISEGGIGADRYYRFTKGYTEPEGKTRR